MAIVINYGHSTFLSNFLVLVFNLYNIAKVLEYDFLNVSDRRSQLSIYQTSRSCDNRVI